MAEAAMSYTLPDRQDYIQDISKLALNWEMYFDTPDWMLDYEEKYAAMFDPDGRLMSCLHRGDMQKYPENSIEGLISAVRMGADMVEIDPRRTKDGVLILLHDETLTRITSERYTLNVEQSDFSDFENIILPDLDGSYVRRDIRVPLFSEYVSICKKYGKRCIVEIKGLFSVENIEKLISEIRELDYLDGVVFIAFDLENCINVRRLLPDAEVQYLVGAKPESNEEVTAILKEHRLDLDIYYKRLTKEWIDELHSAGLKVNCWTCDDPQEAEALVEMGIDFITSNILE